MDSSKPGKFIYGDYELDYEPFYVGKGISDRIKQTLYDKSPFKKNKINKLKSLDIEILSIKLIENLSNSESIDKEIELISLIGRRDKNKGTLVNMTDGGDGRLSSPHSEETKKKISISRTGKGIGWKHKEETLKIMSDNQRGDGNGFYGKTHSYQNKRDHSDRVSGFNHPMYGKKHSDKTIDKLIEHRRSIPNSLIKESCQVFNKPVLMYDLSLNFIKEFESVKQTSEEMNINESIISKCCRGDIKNPTRFYFRYKNKEDNIKNNKFLIEIGDEFLLNRSKYKLLKRNKKTCICLNNGEEVILHINDHKILFEKDTNNIDIVEMYLFIKNIDGSFRLKDNIIFNKSTKIEYVKILNNSEIFGGEMSNSDYIIFSDEWENKPDIVKSRLRNILNDSDRIYARRCNIKEVKDNKLVRKFLNDNHIQGFVGSKYKIGLFYEDELVSLMTFGNLRKSMGLNSKEGHYELLRFCNKLNTSVVGGASKLFKFFLKEFDVSYILSYSDNRWGHGNLYERLGFKYINSTIPNYYYIIDNKRHYRFKYRKDILVSDGYDPSKTEIEIMTERGYYRIFDKGSNKYEYFI